MTVEVKKGAFEIKGSPIELLYLQQCLEDTRFRPCLTCVSCNEKVNDVLRPIAEASKHSSSVNFEELVREANRISNGQSKA